MNVLDEARLTIRRATADDAASLALVGAATFLETYSELVQGRDMILHARTKHADSVYADWASDPDVCMWIAETQTKAPAGYLVLIPATLPLDSPRPQDLEVLRIYVLDRYQKTGLGHALMLRAIAEATSRETLRVVLGVNCDNAKALAFYSRQGFRMIGHRAFSVGTAVFDDFVLALELNGKSNA